MTEPGATGDGTSPHETCEVCRTIPDVAVSTTRGETTSGTPLPPAVGRLVVVGAPYFDDDMSSSNRALHRCPVCGTLTSESLAIKRSSGSETLYYCSPECEKRAESV
ncbi:hypothetical protein FBQ97_21115 [Acidobacteria bacterium ACD]|nr:hypothetical protein [Acidobacteria bacterium ACD]